MTITIKTEKEFDFFDLTEKCWAGALDTLKTVSEHDKEDELISLLNEVFDIDIPTITEINDYLWFNDNCVFESLGIVEGEEKE